MTRDDETEPAPVRWTSSRVWKAVACLPLVLLCAALMLKAVDRIAASEPARETAGVQQASVAEVGQSRTLAPGEQQRKERKAASERTSDAATAEASAASSPAEQLAQPEQSEPSRTLESGGGPETTSLSTSSPSTSSPSTSSPSTSSPSTSSPSPSSPAPTPTPEEAREACKRAGVNPLDVAAMSQCVADSLGG